MGPCAWSHDRVCNVALGTASVQVWVGQVRIYCGDHIVLVGNWSWAIPYAWILCSPLGGGGGGIQRYYK